MWQDWALTFTQVVFIASLVPTILHPTKKPTLVTSLITVPTIFFVAFIYFSLELWFSMTAALVLACQWAIIGYQRWLLDREVTS